MTVNKVRTVELRSIFVNATLQCKIKLACHLSSSVIIFILSLLNKSKGIFGTSPYDDVGKAGFPPKQAAPSFPSSFPHLFSGNDELRFLIIPCAIDQVQLISYLIISA